ncbi:MAG: FkbM family methyltransferase [Hyphomonadaceae bacterium]
MFDVGAHIGLFSCMTSAIFESFNPYILAFEPSHDTSTTAVNIRNTNNFKYDLVRKAVSNTTGEVKFYLSAVSEASNSLNANFREGSREITVPVTTIDEVVEQGACLPTIIKIDVETFEYAVILGGTRTLRQAKPIIFCELLNKSDKQLTQMALSSLEAIGYKFYQIRPEKNWKARTASEAIREISNVHRDWLLTTEKLDGDFYDKFGNWKSSIDLLDETANTLVPPGEALPTLAGEV